MSPHVHGPMLCRSFRVLMLHDRAGRHPPPPRNFFLNFSKIISKIFLKIFSYKFLGKTDCIKNYKNFPDGAYRRCRTPMCCSPNVLGKGSPKAVKRSSPYGSKSQKLAFIEKNEFQSKSRVIPKKYLGLIGIRSGSRVSVPVAFQKSTG